MGWSCGWDSNWNRDIGYGVPALCDHPKCNARINRGLAYVCCNQQPYGAYDERGGGCGLFFCGEHSDALGRCSRCRNGRRNKPYGPKPDVKEWLEWKLTDESWSEWRKDSPEDVAEVKAALATAIVHGECDEEVEA